MGLADMLLNAYGGNAAGMLAQRFGISPEQAQAAVAALAPALSSNIQQNAGSQGGLDALIGALAGGRHQSYVEDPGVLDSPDTILDGNSILGHVLGSKDVSRQVAREASSQTGLGADLLKQMLPVIAAMTMGVLSSHANQGQQQSSQSGGGLLGTLGSLLTGGGQSSTAGTLIDILGRLTR